MPLFEGLSHAQCNRAISLVQHFTPIMSHDESNNSSSHPRRAHGASIHEWSSIPLCLARERAMSTSKPSPPSSLKPLAPPGVRPFSPKNRRIFELPQHMPGTSVGTIPARFVSPYVTLGFDACRSKSGATGRCRTARAEDRGPSCGSGHIFASGCESFFRGGLSRR
jgi:hypothetical protein